MSGWCPRLPASVGAVLASIVALLLGPSLSAAASGEDPTQGRYIVVFHAWIEEDPGDIARAHVAQYGGRLGFVYRHALKGYSVSELPESSVEPLREDPRVKRVERDHIASIPSMEPPAPPSIERQWVTDVRPDDATLHAEIDSNGLATYYELQIDTTGNFKFFQTSSCPLNVPGIGCATVIVEGDPLAPGLLQPVESTLPAGTESQHVSVNMASIGATLQPETTYYYRALAANGPELVAGASQTFTTPPREMVVWPADLEPADRTGSVPPAGIALSSVAPDGLKRRDGTACKRLRRLSGEGRSRRANGARKRCERSATVRPSRTP